MSLPPTLPAITERTVRSSEHIRLTQPITLHDAFGHEFQSDTLVVVTTDDEVRVMAMGITGRQRTVQAQLVDHEESEALLAALDGVSGVRRLHTAPQ